MRDCSRSGVNAKSGAIPREGFVAATGIFELSTVVWQHA